MFINGKNWDAKSPLVMGVINLSPDSFYAGSTVKEQELLHEKITQMVMEGVDIVDIGAYSSRPKAADVSEVEEWNRLAKNIEFIKKAFPDVYLSVDTFRSSIAQKSLDLGVNMINDISSGTLDAGMFDKIAQYNCSYVMMHMKGNPQTMHLHQTYDDIVHEVYDFFVERIALIKEKGFSSTLIIDPGFGFAKNIEQNFELLNRMSELKSLDYPILAGISRKSMIYKSLDILAEDALNGTTALNMFALMRDAKILRVHDVKEAKECIKLYQLSTKNNKE